MPYNSLSKPMKPHILLLLGRVTTSITLTEMEPWLPHGGGGERYNMMLNGLPGSPWGPALPSLQVYSRIEAHRGVGLVVEALSVGESL